MDTALEQEMLTADDEFDVSDAGVQSRDITLNITDFEVVEKDNGVMHAITFESSELNFPITEKYWFTHTNAKAQNIGRAQLKRVSLAATGSPKYNRTSLLNRQVIAQPYEDKNGFVRLRGFKQPSVADTSILG